MQTDKDFVLEAIGQNPDLLDAFYKDNLTGKEEDLEISEEEKKTKLVERILQKRVLYEEKERELQAEREKDEKRRKKWEEERRRKKKEEESKRGSLNRYFGIGR